ncbi:MAG: PQQ-binding-like beta-propeller repeat protein [Candidatus Brocadiaceae bacterium]|jgi:outer membrane protein assembly factor BamB
MRTDNRSAGSRRHAAVFTALVLALVAAAASADAEALARQILSATGVQGGLIVHLGCGDGKLTVALRANDSYLVQGLDADARNVEQAREHLRSLGLCGPVSVDRFDGRHLPYVDDLVNLLVAEDLGEVAMTEVRRVLAPDGTAYIKIGREWTKNVKPRPKNIDDWTHFLHGPDGHVMSNDTVVASPHHIQWVGAPAHSKSHSHLTTINVMVTGGGRLFYIADESLTALPDSLPSRWALVARDAFNGVELWRRPLRRWQPYYVKDRNSYPADLHRRLVAGDDVVFATLSILGPVSALDAATGRTIRTYARTEKTEDIILEDGILYLSVNTADRKQINRLQMAYRHVEPRQKRIMAVDAESGEVIWEKSDGDADGLMPMTLAVKNHRLYFQNPENVVCLEKATGEVLWRSARRSEYFRPGWSSPNLVAFDGVVISADRQSGPDQKIGKDQYAAGGFSTGDLVAFSAEDGRRLWSEACAEGCRAPTDVFGRDGKLWFGKSLQRQVHEYRQVHDLRTGEVLSETPADEKWPSWHHHRCYRDKATRNYILAGRTGTEFINLDTGEVTLHTWLRGNCKFGVLPGNGLIYSPPDQCGCYIESKLSGFHAVAPKRSSELAKPDTHPLETGPAYGKAGEPEPRGLRPGDWPTFRADNARSGRAGTAVGTELKQSWRVELGGRLTQPVVAGGRLLVASVDTHTLHAVNARTGEMLWSFVAGGRIDSPPTIARGLAVFGCRDGWVYVLDAADGELSWRYRAAPDDRALVDNGRVESVWPVHGSVLVQDPGADSGRALVYFAAGRSSYLDGGVRMGKLDLLTGRPVLNKTFYSRDPATAKTVELYPRFATGRLRAMDMPGVLPDVLSSDGERVWMRSVTFDADLTIQEEFPPHLFSSVGFLDDSGWELSYWIYGQHMFSGRAGIAHATRLYPTARIMVCGNEEIYGYQGGYEGIKEPALVASSKKPKLETVERRGKKATRVLSRWTQDVPLHVHGLVLAAETLFMAGPPRIDEAKTRELLATLTMDEYHPPPVLRDATETFMGERGGLLCAVSTDDGAKVMEMRLPSIPVFDGMIAAQGRLYVALADGSVASLE